MVYHHDRGVYHDTQRHCNSCKGIYMYADTGKCIYRKGYQQIHRKGQDYYEHISPRTAHGKDKQQENQYA